MSLVLKSLNLIVLDSTNLSNTFVIIAPTYRLRELEENVSNGWIN
jgi:hypothetical protein